MIYLKCNLKEIKLYLLPTENYFLDYLYITNQKMEQKADFNFTTI